MLSRIVKKLLNWIKAQSRQPKILVLDLVIGALTVFLVFMSGFAVKEMSYNFGYYDEDNFYWRMQGEDYPDMVSMYYSNVAKGKEDVKELQEYYGVARYFEAAADYKMYIEAGENEQAQEALEKMNEAYEQMGDFSMVKGKIDKKLGL